MAAEPLADFYIRDEGAALRRTGGWLVFGGFVVATIGLATLLFAVSTGSGYEAQGTIAMLIGGGIIAWGMNVLREGARRGPRLIPVPVSTSPVRARNSPMGTDAMAPGRHDTMPAIRPRVKVASWHEPLRELPRSDRS